MAKRIGHYLPSTSVMQKSFWAYAVTSGNAVLVRCQTAADAVEEKDRMKGSNATKVGHTTRKATEAEMWSHVRKSGWKLEVVRNQRAA